MKYAFNAVVLLFIVGFYQVAGESTVTIPTQNGSIKGAILISDYGNRFRAFRGIPYAQPPINSLRFKPPVGLGPWNGSLDATKDAAVCLQVNDFDSKFAPRIFGEENCLYLNVYRNENYPTEKFPVMVFIHGGGYRSGSGSSLMYGPHRFMDKNVVLVTLNYRLGPFGFLSTSDEAAPGNYGLLDVVSGLRWIQTNIDDFGGDKNKVTIFGESAGGAIVSLLILSPLAKGLFHGAIAQSGNAFNDWSHEYENPLNLAVNLAKDFQCNNANHGEMIKCLQAVSAVDIIEKCYPLPGTYEVEPVMFAFRPTVDKARRSNAFLPHPPKQQLSKGDINIVPLILGTTRDEGLVFYMMPALAINGLNRSDSEMLLKIMALVAPNLTKNIKKNNQTLNLIYEKYLQNVSNVTSLEDRVKVMNEVFGGDSLTTADNFNELYAKRGGLVYPYKLTYRGQQSWFETLEAASKTMPPKFIHNLQMVAHGDDLQYLFTSSYFNATNFNGTDHKMTEVMLTLWTNFAQSNIPYFEEKLDDYQCERNYRWNALNYNNPQYLDLNLESKSVAGYLSDDRDFWNKVYNFWNKDC